MNCKVYFGSMGFEQHSRSDGDSESEIMVSRLIISDRMWPLVVVVVSLFVYADTVPHS